MTRISVLTAIALFTACVGWAADNDALAGRMYHAIRDGNNAALNELLQQPGAENAADKRGNTALMNAAAFGNLESMRALLKAGADVNAKNGFQATALMWCTNDIAKVRLLLDHGADVQARSKIGRTPLLIAAAHDGNAEVVRLLLAKGAKPVDKDAMLQTTPLLVAVESNDVATVKLLLEKGANPNDKDRSGGTALMSAAALDNLELMRLLLKSGSDVNAVTAPSVAPPVKNGLIAIGALTPLVLAASYAGPEAVKMLLDAGAKVDALDVRGMTPLMLAVATDHPDPRVVKLLLDKGADPAIKSAAGETAADWAKKFRIPTMLQMLNVPAEAIAVSEAETERKPLNQRAALTKSIALLQRTSQSFFKASACISCHSQNLTAVAVGAARSSGIAIDETAAAEERKAVVANWAPSEQVLLQRMDPPGGSEMLEYSLIQMHAAGMEPDRVTDAMIHNVAAEQARAGNWHRPGLARPPMEDCDSSRTAMGIRVLRVYGIPSRKAEFDGRIERAAGWLASAAPCNMEDRAMQLAGLVWANATPATVAPFKSKLIAARRPDGGWAQKDQLESDAYATGQALFALHEAGVPASDAVYRAGVNYLLRTQLEDGSWHVKSRAPKFQPYFQSGFPHGQDQWISAAATAWAATALAYGDSEETKTASIRR